MTILAAHPDYVEPAPIGPQGWQDWPGLRAWADRLLGEARSSTATPDADLRALEAVAALWKAMVERADMPTRIRATRAEIRSVLARRVSAAPRATMASALGTLLWWHQPQGGGHGDTPRIVAVLSINAQVRRDRARKAAQAATANDNPGGRHVDRSAARASVQQAAERPQRPAATQPGLL